VDFYRRPDVQISDIVAFTLEECIGMSGSPLGFFGFINEDESLMTAHLWSEEAMKGCSIDFKPVEFSLEHAGIWAEAIRRHEPLIVNDYLRPDPRKKGYPEGHVPVQRLMSIPIIREVRAVAIMAVANKQDEYTQNDILHLSLFLESAWDMIARKRAEEQIEEHASNLTRINEQLREEILLRERAEEERRRSEQRLQQAQKAESLGRMAGAIAHHFNNMLGIVMGNMELALYQLPEGLSPRQYLAEAMGASRRAAEISRLMLAYLGQTSGKMQPLDLVEAVREAVTLLIVTVPKGVRLRTELPPEALVIMADASHVKQILTNLVTNAWEAIGEREGEITVGVYPVPAAAIEKARFFPMDWKPKAQNYACLSVSDTGSGLDEATIEKIFDPFFSTKFTGRGLGLAVVLGLVRAHEGAITVESEIDCGTGFRVFFPLPEHEIQVSRSLVEPISGAPVSGSLILVVDDEPMLRKMAQTMLNRMGYEAITAGDGIEAVEIFRGRKGEFRLVLLDLSMPRMAGWETIEVLRALRRDIPVILASGYDEAQVDARLSPGATASLFA
jgi:signal transduction histidine kinase